MKENLKTNCNNPKDNGNKTRPRKAKEGEAFIYVNSEKKPYVCSLCGKPFANKHFVEIHYRTHTGEKPYKCSTCNKGFTQNGLLTTHQRTHTGEKPYSCSECSKSFTQKIHLQTHQRLHSGVLSYVCSQCNKTFNSKYSLKYHVLRHSGEKPHVCSVCKIAFARKGHLQKHYKTHITPKQNYEIIQQPQKRASLMSVINKIHNKRRNEKIVESKAEEPKVVKTQQTKSILDQLLPRMMSNSEKSCDTAL